MCFLVKFKRKNKMKKITLISALFAAAFSMNAAPLVTIGDQLDLFFKGEVSGAWNSNITYRNQDKVNDYSAVFRLGGELDYGRNSKFKANVKFLERLTRFAERKEFNSNLASLFATASYTESQWKVLADFSFVQNYQNTSTTTQANASGDLVRSDIYNAGITGTYDFTEKFYGELGFRWYSIQYQGMWGDLYSDLDTYSVPVSILYRVTEKISAGLTYTYRYTEFSGGNVFNSLFYGDSRSDHSVGVTVRGQLLPKLNALLYGGWVYRDPQGGLDPSTSESESTFALRAELGYELTEKIGLFAIATRDFGSGAQRQISLNTGCEVGANYAITSYLTATTSFSYTNAEYQQSDDREDDIYIARVGLSYIPNQFIKISANYRYYNNASNLEAAAYNQHMVDLTFALRY